MKTLRKANWGNDAGSDALAAEQAAIAAYQASEKNQAALAAALAANDPGPTLTASEKKACDAKYPKAAKSNGKIGEVKNWKSCYASAESDGQAATSAYQQAVQAGVTPPTTLAPPANTPTQQPTTTNTPTQPATTATAPTTGPASGSGSSSTDSSGSSSTTSGSSSTTYIILAVVLLLLLGGGAYMFLKPAAAATKFSNEYK